MANYLPVLLVSVSAGIMPDDASLQPLPRGQVDYLSHDWAQEEDVWRSWRSMTKNKNEIANGVRLENASWRTWWKQRNNLKTISPETLNWLKDSDVTWLYGPLHTAIDWTPPPGPRPPLSSPARSHSNTPSPPVRPPSSIAKPSSLKKSPSMSSPSSSVALSDTYVNHPQTRPYGPGYGYGYLPSSTSTTPSSASSSSSSGGMKPILKHRSISEMLTGALPAMLDASSSFAAYNGTSNASNFPINPIAYPPSIIDEDFLDAQAAAMAPPEPPGFSSSSYFPPSTGPDSVMRPRMQHTRSDTNILRRLAHRERQLRPPRVAVAAALQHDQLDPLPYSHSPSRTPSNTPPPRSLASPSPSSSSASSAAPSTPSSRVNAHGSLSPSSRTHSPSGSRTPSTYYSYHSQAPQVSQSQAPQKKHISFNAIVEQCISIDSDADSPSTLGDHNAAPLSMYGHQTDYLDSTESGKYSARRIWEEYGDDDVEHSQFAGDLQEVEEDNRYEDDEDNLAGGLFEAVRERANLSEPAHTGSPPLSISGSYPPLPVLSPSSPTQRQSFSSGPSTNDTPQLYGDRQTYSRRTISFREEDEDDEEDDDDDDDVIEIKTPSRRSSSSSLSSAGKLSPTTGKYPLLAEQPREISRPKEDTPTVSRTIDSSSYATDRLSATSPTAQQSALVSGNDSRSSSANTSDRTTTKRVPVARKVKSRRGGRVAGGYTSGSGSGSNSGSGSRSRSANGPRYAACAPGYATYGYPGLFNSTTSIGQSEHMTIAPIAPTVLKAGGRSGSGNDVDKGDEDEEREVQELGRELEKLGEEGTRSSGGVFYVGGGYPYGPNLASGVYGRYGGYSGVGHANVSGYGGGTYGFDGYGSYHLDENDEIGLPEGEQEDAAGSDNDSLVPTFVPGPLVRSPSPNLTPHREIVSPSGGPGILGSDSRTNAERPKATEVAGGRDEELLSASPSSLPEPKENPRIASLKSSEAFFYPQQQQQRERERPTSPSSPSTSVVSTSGPVTPASSQSSPATSVNTVTRKGNQSTEEDAASATSTPPPSLPPPTLAVATPAVSLSHSRYAHADGFSDSHARRFLSPPDTSSLSPSSRTSSPSVPTSCSSSDIADPRSGAISPRGRSLTRSQKPGSLGGSGGSAEPERERGRSRSRSTAASSITSGANSPTLSDSGGSCYNSSSSPSARRQNGILGIGSSYGAAVYGGIGGVVPHSGREVRDGRGVRLYRKTSEDFISSSAGSSAERDIERGRVSYGHNYRVKNVRGPRGSDSLSPVGGAYVAPSFSSTQLKRDGDESYDPRSMKRIGSKDGLAYQSYSVNTFGTGSYVQDEGGLKHTLPIVEESADERPDSISERTSNTRRVNQTDLDSPPSRRSSTTVQPSRPRSPPSTSELVPSPPSMLQAAKQLPASVASPEAVAQGTIVGKAADLLSTTRGILGVFWSS